MIKPEEKVRKRKPREEILNETGVGEEELLLLKKCSKKRELTQYKLQYIKKAQELNYTLQEIGEMIGINRSGVYNLIKRFKL